MKRMLQTLLLCMALFLSACGISKADYDSVLSKNDTLSAENEALSSTIKSLNADIDSLSQQVKTLEEEKQAIQKEYLDYQTKITLDDFDDSYGKAWATTSFGDTTTCLINDAKTHFQCIASNRYEITEAGISSLWKEFIQASATLSLINEINYETISVRFYDPSDAFIMDIILTNDNGKYVLDALSCNLAHISIIMSALSTN